MDLLKSSIEENSEETSNGHEIKISQELASC